jgi:hypothetical protein
VGAASVKLQTELPRPRLFAGVLSLDHVSDNSKSRCPIINTACDLVEWRRAWNRRASANLRIIAHWYVVIETTHATVEIGVRSRIVKKFGPKEGAAA